MQTIADHIKLLLFPRTRCLGCNEPRKIDKGSPLCDDCAVELEDLKLIDGVCPHCLSPKRSSARCEYCADSGMRGLTAAYSPFAYHSVSQKLIIQLKYQGIYQAAEPLIDGMISCFPGSSFDLMVPVPLYKSSFRKRGFNQSEHLCHLLRQHTAIPYQNALEKILKTKQQSTLSHQKRKNNLKDAFIAVLPVKDKRILLVDDVRTTGSTARICAQVLLNAGAMEVSLMTAAVAGNYSKISSSSSFDSTAIR